MALPAVNESVSFVDCSSNISFHRNRYASFANCTLTSNSVWLLTVFDRTNLGPKSSKSSVPLGRLGIEDKMVTLGNVSLLLLVVGDVNDSRRGGLRLSDKDSNLRMRFCLVIFLSFSRLLVRCLLILVLSSEQSLSISFRFFVILFLRMCKSLWCSRRVLCKIEKVRLLQYRDTFLFFNNSEDT